MSTRIKIDGLAEFGRLVSTLQQEPNKKAGRRAISAGVNILAKTYRTNAPVDRSGVKKKSTHVPMKRAVGRKFRRGSSRRAPVGKVGYNVNKKGGRRAFHAHLPLLGTAVRTTRSGRNRGRVTANPKVGNAINAAVPRAIHAMRQRWYQEFRSA